jgi:hypothetical protein
MELEVAPLAPSKMHDNFAANLRDFFENHSSKIL